MPHTPSSDRATTRNPETAPPRIATWTASTRLRRAADAVRTLERTLMVMPMMPESIEQPAPTRKANAVRTPIGMPARIGTSATSGVSTTAMTTPMITDATTASTRDRRVLALDERVGALADRVGHVHHGLGAGVAGQDVARQVGREQDRGDARDRDDPVERRFAHQRLQSLLPRVRNTGDPCCRVERTPGGIRAGARAPAPDVGTSPTGVRNAGEPPRRRAECMRARSHGSNDFRAPVDGMQGPVGLCIRLPDRSSRARRPYPPTGADPVLRTRFPGRGPPDPYTPRS